MVKGQFVTVRPSFAFIRPEGEDRNVYVTGSTLASLRRLPRRGDRARFRLASTRDGRRRAIDLVLVEAAP